MSVETFGGGDDSRKFPEGSVRVNRMGGVWQTPALPLHNTAVVQFIVPIVFWSRPTANHNLEARADQRFGDVFRWPVHDQDYTNRFENLYRIQVHDLSSRPGYRNSVPGRSSELTIFWLQSAVDANETLVEHIGVGWN